MLIVANWKAYVETRKKADALVSLAKRLAKKTNSALVLAPSDPFIGVFAPKNISSVSFAAQDVSHTLGGAHTGEVTAPVLAGLGATYVIIGHSERRRAGESYLLIAEKMQRALAHNLIPILCVGEEARDTDGKYLTVVREEITSALEVLSPKDRSRVILAYEPLWAIGKSAAEAITPTDLAEMVLYLRKVLAELLPGKSSGRTKVLYGGSVEPENIRDLAGAASIDGFLVGHASVDPTSFAALVRALS